jgi:hypothetical protein
LIKISTGPTGLRDAIRHLLRGLKFQVQDGHLRAAFRQRPGHLAAEYAAAAGDDGHLVFQIDMKRD